MIVKNKQVALKPRVHGRNRRGQKGFGLVEVLVALVVVSFGVLGMASLQLTGMKQSSGGFNRSKALLFAQSMATRIRLNTEAVAAAQGYGGLDSSGISCANVPTPYCQATPTAPNPPMCSSPEMARMDFFTVACGDLGSQGATKGVNGTLPGGAIAITCIDGACGEDSSYMINVTWSEGKSRTNSDEMITRRVQVRLKP